MFVSIILTSERARIIKMRVHLSTKKCGIILIKRKIIYPLSPFQEQRGYSRDSLIGPLRFMRATITR